MTDNAPTAANPVVFFDLALGGEHILCDFLQLISTIRKQFSKKSFKSNFPCFISLHRKYPHFITHMHCQTISQQQRSLEGRKVKKISNIPLKHLGEPLGRVKMELFADITPKTAENFRQYCTGETKNGQGYPQGYKGSKFHRVVREP